MVKPPVLLALCFAAAPLAHAGTPPSNAHAESAIAETKAARDGAVADKADDEAAFAARYDYAAALFNANRFADAAAELKAMGAMKAVAKDTTNYVMTHAGLMLMDLALQNPKGAADEFSLAEKRMPSKFRETAQAHGYLTTIWFIKGAGQGKIVMGELFRPARLREARDLRSRGRDVRAVPPDARRHRPALAAGQGQEAREGRDDQTRRAARAP
jgi:hypothetical protein